MWEEGGTCSEAAILYNHRVEPRLSLLFSGVLKLSHPCFSHTTVTSQFIVNCWMLLFSIQRCPQSQWLPWLLMRSKNAGVTTLMFEAVALGFLCGVLEFRKAWDFWYLGKRCILVKTKLKIKLLSRASVLDFVSVCWQGVIFIPNWISRSRTTGACLCICTGRSSDKLSHPGTVQAGQWRPLSCLQPFSYPEIKFAEQTAVGLCFIFH